MFIHCIVEKTLLFTSHYCLQALSTEKILQCHVKDCFKSNGKLMIKKPEKGKYVRFKNYEKKLK